MSTTKYDHLPEQEKHAALAREEAAIKAEGYPVTTPLIVCNTDDYAAVVAKASGTVKQGDALLELKH